jgi:superfamily II DNA or RNA helicase
MTKTAKIIIKDEVHCKIENLDLDVRRALMKKYEVEKPGVRFLPSVRLGRWNGKVSYFSLGGTTYVNLLEEIIETLLNHNYDIDLDDQRIGHQSFVFDRVDDQFFSSKVWPVGHVKAGEPIVLRDHQVKIINELLANPQSIVIAATGAGKTLITAALSKSMEQYGRSIVMVPSKQLVEQTEADYINLGMDVGVFFGDRKDFTKTHTICTWQSLNSLLKSTKEGTAQTTIQELIEGVVCVIGDECHQVKADVLQTLLSGIFSNIPLRWGFTGTLPKDRFSQMALLTNLGPVVAELEASELQEKGVLAQCHVNIMQLKDEKVNHGTYQAELKYLLADEKRIAKIANMILNISETGNTLVLIDRIEPGKILASKIPGAIFISGETSLADRKKEYNEIKVINQKILIASYGIASTGVDIPRIFNLVLIEPGKSFVRVIQSIGRGIRIADDKNSVEIWDITSTCKFSKRHLTARKAFYEEAKYPYTIKKIDL